MDTCPQVFALRTVTCFDFVSFWCFGFRAMFGGGSRFASLPSPTPNTPAEILPILKISVSVALIRGFH